MIRLILPLLALAVPLHAETAGPAETRPRPVVSVKVNYVGAVAESHVGTIVPKVEVDLGFPLGGTVADRPVDVGDRVRAGDVLARLTTQDLEASLRAAQAGVVVAEAQANSARDARDRAAALAQTGAGAQTRLEDAERALVAATARLDQARAALAQARDLLSLATLVAPRDGVITATYAEPGATLAAGQPVLRLSDAENRELLIDLTEADAAAKTPGDVFTVSLVANPEITARAVLDRIDPVAESATRTRRAHLRIDSPPEAFRIGALARAEASAPDERALVLPRSAVLERDGRPAVWVVDRDTDTVRAIPVVIGAEAGDFVVIAEGLSAGDEVVVRGIHSLRDGQKVGAGVPK